MTYRGAWSTEICASCGRRGALICYPCYVEMSQTLQTVLGVYHADAARLLGSRERKLVEDYRFGVSQ